MFTDWFSFPDRISFRIGFRFEFRIELNFSFNLIRFVLCIPNVIPNLHSFLTSSVDLISKFQDSNFSNLFPIRDAHNRYLKNSKSQRNVQFLLDKNYTAPFSSLASSPPRRVLHPRVLKAVHLNIKLGSQEAKRPSGTHLDHGWQKQARHSCRDDEFNDVFPAGSPFTPLDTG